MTSAYVIFLCHFIGDYFLQSDWMALNKNKQTFPCLVHVLIYTLCFTPFLGWKALLFVGITHFIIDRFGIAKYIIWIKNHINPEFKYDKWQDCRITGYNDQLMSGGRPFWLTLMLYIVADNTLHLICNEIARTALWLI